MQRLTSRCAKRAARPTSSQGFALLEALVALLVVALGLSLLRQRPAPQD